MPAPSNPVINTTYYFDELAWRWNGTAFFCIGVDRTNAVTLPAVDGVTGTGSPAGVVSAPVGTLYRRTDGGANTTLYVKESGGTGNTGWVAK